MAHIVVDGVIDIPRTKSYNVNDGKADGKIDPDAVSSFLSGFSSCSCRYKGLTGKQIADSYWHLHSQHRSSFTQELDLRPYVEKF